MKVVGEILNRYKTPEGVYYLDNASCRLLRDEVLEDLQKILSDYSGNISGPHPVANKVNEEFQKSLFRIADNFGCQKNEVVCTSGATESISIVARNCVDRQLKVAFCENDHPAIENACKEIHAFGGEVSILPMLPSCEDFRQALERGTDVIFVSHVHSELGHVRQISEFLSLCREYGATLICDFTQSLGHIDIASIDFDIGLASAQKSGGLPGLGVLIDKTGFARIPLFQNGSAGELRPGTLNYSGFIHWSRTIGLFSPSIRWRQHWSEINCLLFDGKASLVSIPHSCDWILNARLGLQDQSAYSKKVCWSKGTACKHGVLSSAFSNLYHNPEEIIRLSF